MTNKQAATTTSDWDKFFDLTEEGLRSWLFGPFEKQRAPIYEAKERMREQGISDSLINNALHWETGAEERRYKTVLKLVTNSKTGKFWTTDALQLTGQLSDAEIESIRAEHKDRLPPYYYIYSIFRWYDNRSTPTKAKSYIGCNFMFEGLCVGKPEGVVNAEPNLKINTSGTIGHYSPVQLRWDVLRDTDGEDKRVATYNGIPPQDNNLRVYEIPYSREVYEAMIKHTLDGRAALHIIDLSKNRVYTPRNEEEFLAPDNELPKIIESYNTPQPTFDVKSLIDEMEKRARAKFEAEADAHNQYG